MFLYFVIAQRINEVNFKSLTEFVEKTIVLRSKIWKKFRKNKFINNKR